MADVGWFMGLGLWSAAIVMAIKPLHGYFMKKGCEDMVAVYYNRKIAHMLAGGVPILASPIVFSDPIMAFAWRFDRGSNFGQYPPHGQAALVDANDSEHERCHLFIDAWTVGVRIVGLFWRAVVGRSSRFLHGLWRWGHRNHPKQTVRSQNKKRVGKPRHGGCVLACRISDRSVTKPRHSPLGAHIWSCRFVCRTV